MCIYIYNIAKIAWACPCPHVDTWACARVYIVVYLSVCLSVCLSVYLSVYHSVCLSESVYGVAMISRLLQMIGLFCKILSLLQGSFAKKTYNFEEPTNRNHPISICLSVCLCLWFSVRVTVSICVYTRLYIQIQIYIYTYTHTHVHIYVHIIYKHMFMYTYLYTYMTKIAWACPRSVLSLGCHTWLWHHMQATRMQLNYMWQFQRALLEAVRLQRLSQIPNCQKKKSLVSVNSSPHLNELCHTNTWVMSHKWMSHVT